MRIVAKQHHPVDRLVPNSHSNLELMKRFIDAAKNENICCVISMSF